MEGLGFKVWGYYGGFRVYRATMEGLGFKV